MGRKNELIGEALRVTRTGGVAALLDVHVEYDEESRTTPMLLTTKTYADGVALEVRAVQVDTGWEIGRATPNDSGFVLNVTVRNTGATAVGVNLTAAVDWLANLTSLSSPKGSMLADSDGKAILCGSTGGWMPGEALRAGHLSADGFRPGHNAWAGSSTPGAADNWADSWALSGNYDGQNGHVGRPVGGGILRYAFAGLPKSSKVYVAIAPAISLSASGMPVEAGSNASFISGGNGSAVFYLSTETDTTGRLQVATGAVPSAPQGWKGAVSLSGLWVYGREALKDSVAARPNSNRETHACDPHSGYDSKHGQCLHVKACDKTSLTQQFERFPCSHWDGNSDGVSSGVPLPVNAECLSHRGSSGQRRWLNAELWGAATCEVENGPLISYGSFVWPVYGGAICGRNQFFTFSAHGSDNAGTIRNNITVRSLLITVAQLHSVYSRVRCHESLNC